MHNGEKFTMADQQAPKNDEIKEASRTSEPNTGTNIITQLEEICGPLASAKVDSSKISEQRPAGSEEKPGLKEKELLSALLTTGLITSGDLNDDPKASSKADADDLVDEPKASAKEGADEKSYKPTAEELDNALKSDNPAKALAKIADRLVAEVKPKPGQGLNIPGEGLNDTKFRAALEEHIKRSELITRGGGLAAAMEFANATGPKYIVGSNSNPMDGSVNMQFFVQKEKVALEVNANGDMAPGPRIANDLKIANPRAALAEDWAKRITVAAKSTGPEKGLNDPAIRKQIEDFVEKNYLNGASPDYFGLQKQLLDKISPDYRAELMVGESEHERVNLRFSKVGQDGGSDMTIRPFSSQAELAAELAKQFEASSWRDQASMARPIGSLYRAFQGQIKEAKTPAEADYRCRALVAKINEANETGRLKLPRDFKFSKEVEYEPRIKVKFDDLKL